MRCPRRRAKGSNIVDGSGPRFIRSSQSGEMGAVAAHRRWQFPGGGRAELMARHAAFHRAREIGGMDRTGGRHAHHRQPVGRRIDRRRLPLARRTDRLERDPIAGLRRHALRIDQAIAADEELIFRARQVGHDEATLIVCDHDPGEAAREVGGLGDDPHTALRSLFADDRSANVVPVDGRRRRCRRGRLIRRGQRADDGEHQSGGRQEQRTIGIFISARTGADRRCTVERPRATDASRTQPRQSRRPPGRSVRRVSAGHRLPQTRCD